MTINDEEILLDLQNLSDLAKSEQRDKAMIDGKIEAGMDQLSDNGYKSIEQAVKGTKQLQKKHNSLGLKINIKLAEFKELFGDKLSEYI